MYLSIILYPANNVLLRHSVPILAVQARLHAPYNLFSSVGLLERGGRVHQLQPDDLGCPGRQGDPHVLQQDCAPRRIQCPSQ